MNSHNIRTPHSATLPSSFNVNRSLHSGISLPHQDEKYDVISEEETQSHKNSNYFLQFEHLSKTKSISTVPIVHSLQTNKNQFEDFLHSNPTSKREQHRIIHSHSFDNSNKSRVDQKSLAVQKADPISPLLIGEEHKRDTFGECSESLSSDLDEIYTADEVDEVSNNIITLHPQDITQTVQPDISNKQVSFLAYRSKESELIEAQLYGLDDGEDDDITDELEKFAQRLEDERATHNLSSFKDLAKRPLQVEIPKRNQAQQQPSNLVTIPNHLNHSDFAIHNFPKPPGANQKQSDNQAFTPQKQIKSNFLRKESFKMQDKVTEYQEKNGGKEQLMVRNQTSSACEKLTQSHDEIDSSANITAFRNNRSSEILPSNNSALPNLLYIPNSKNHYFEPPTPQESLHMDQKSIKQKEKQEQNKSTKFTDKFQQPSIPLHLISNTGESNQLNQQPSRSPTPTNRERLSRQETSRLIQSTIIQKQNAWLKKQGETGRNQDLLSGKILNCLDINSKNQLLSIIDANMNFDQLSLLLSSLAFLMKSYKQEGNTFEISGLNLNGNQDLDDQAMKKLVKFACDHHQMKVLSVERFKLSHLSVVDLFLHIHLTHLFEVNLSGIPLSYHCIEQMCISLDQNPNKLRVLHLRNTRLNDLSALKLMECIVGIDVSQPLKIRYLSLSMNNKLGFNFQNGLIKMLQDALSFEKQAADGQRVPLKFELKYIDLKHCNINQQNLKTIKILIAKNHNIEIEDDVSDIKSTNNRGASVCSKAKQSSSKPKSRSLSKNKSGKKTKQLSSLSIVSRSKGADNKYNYSQIQQANHSSLSAENCPDFKIRSITEPTSYFIQAPLQKFQSQLCKFSAEQISEHNQHTDYPIRRVLTQPDNRSIEDDEGIKRFEPPNYTLEMDKINSTVGGAGEEELEFLIKQSIQNNRESHFKTRDDIKLAIKDFQKNQPNSSQLPLIQELGEWEGRMNQQNGIIIKPFELVNSGNSSQQRPLFSDDLIQKLNDLNQLNQITHDSLSQPCSNITPEDLVKQTLLQVISDKQNVKEIPSTKSMTQEIENKTEFNLARFGGTKGLQGLDQTFQQLKSIQNEKEKTTEPDPLEQMTKRSETEEDEKNMTNPYQNREAYQAEGEKQEVLQINFNPQLQVFGQQMNQVPQRRKTSQSQKVLPYHSYQDIHKQNQRYTKSQGIEGQVGKSSRIKKQTRKKSSSQSSSHDQYPKTFQNFQSFSSVQQQPQSFHQPSIHDSSQNSLVYPYTHQINESTFFDPSSGQIYTQNPRLSFEGDQPGYSHEYQMSQFYKGLESSDSQIRDLTVQNTLFEHPNNFIPRMVHDDNLMYSKSTLGKMQKKKMTRRSIKRIKSVDQRLIEQRRDQRHKLTPQQHRLHRLDMGSNGRQSTPNTLKNVRKSIDFYRPSLQRNNVKYPQKKKKKSKSRNKLDCRNIQSQPIVYQNLGLSGRQHVPYDGLNYRLMMQ